jgi:enamine deaminase RidA (YjgF/YER057c/UK114 family)
MCRVIHTHHISQAVKVNGLLFVSGCLGLDAKTGEFPSTVDVVAQTEVVCYLITVITVIATTL